MNKKIQKLLLLILALIVVFAVKGIQGWMDKDDADTDEQTEQTLLGQTSTTQTDTDWDYEDDPQQASDGRAKGIEIPAYLTDREEEIVQHEGFTLSYNRRHRIPNWVGWKLTPDRVHGGEKRAENFQPDRTVKQGPIAYDSDYRRSGYGRGHMCPSADNTHSRQAQNDCFLLSNICPQLYELNSGDWEVLERQCRRWATRYDSIYIVCGPVLKHDQQYEHIGRNQVTVPRQFYKVVFRWTRDHKGEAIGFLFDHNKKSRPLREHAVSVDSVESVTGINFFSKLPKSVERKCEATFDTGRWSGLSKL